jgi:hypothetical protein
MDVEHEAVLLGGTPSLVRKLKVGALEGIHYLHALDGTPDAQYRARFDLDETLPMLSVAERSAGAAKAFGPSLTFNEAALDERLAARSEGFGFPAALLGHDGVRDFLAETEKLAIDPRTKARIDSVRVMPQFDRGSLLAVDVRVRGNRHAIADGIRLARALAASMAALLDKGQRFSDARAVLASMDTDAEAEVPVEDVKLVEGVLRDATSWVTGHVGRVGKELQVRLLLSDHGLDLEGSLTLAWRGSDLRDHAVALEASLPQVEAPAAKLTPETTGVLGVIKRLGETVLGDDAVDDAFVVRTTEAGRPMLLHAAAPLSALGEVGATVALGDGRLVVRMPEAAADMAALRRQIDQALHLWRAIAAWSAGLRTDAVDPFSFDG